MYFSITVSLRLLKSKNELLEIYYNAEIFLINMVR